MEEIIFLKVLSFNSDEIVIRIIHGIQLVLENG